MTETDKSKQLMVVLWNALSFINLMGKKMVGSVADDSTPRKLLFNTYTYSVASQNLPCYCAWSIWEEFLLQIFAHPKPKNFGHSEKEKKSVIYSPLTVGDTYELQN